MKGNKYRKLVCLFVTMVFLLAFKNVSAQDHHFTHVSFSPIYTNPAFTGFFDGNVRLYANYRNQYSSFLGKGSFQTTYGAADVRIPVGIGCKDFVGAGLVLINDRFGENQLKSTNVSVAASYSKSLAKERAHSLTIGVMGTYFQRKISTDLSGFEFGSQFDGLIFDPNLNSGEIIPGSVIKSLDFSLGLIYFGHITKTFDAYAGFAFAHVVRPEFGFNADINEPLNYRYSGQLGASVQLNEETLIAPIVFVDYQNKITETTLGSLFRNRLIKINERETALIAGVYLRMLTTPVKTIDIESLVVLMGIEYSGLRFSFGYDANVNGLKTATRAQGAFEVGIRYTLSNLFGCRPYSSYCPRL